MHRLGKVSNPAAAPAPADSLSCGPACLPVPHLPSACLPSRPALPCPACSNATLLEETIGGSIDGMLVTGPSDYEKSIAISAAQDPGGRALWCALMWVRRSPCATSTPMQPNPEICQHKPARQIKPARAIPYHACPFASCLKPLRPPPRSALAPGPSIPACRCAQPRRMDEVCGAVLQQGA